MLMLIFSYSFWNGFCQSRYFFKAVLMYCCRDVRCGACLCATPVSVGAVCIYVCTIVIAVAF